jgi:hypothetical protein
MAFLLDGLGRDAVPNHVLELVPELKIRDPFVPVVRLRPADSALG